MKTVKKEFREISFSVCPKYAWYKRIKNSLFVIRNLNLTGYPIFYLASLPQNQVGESPESYLPAGDLA